MGSVFLKFALYPAISRTIFDVGALTGLIAVLLLIGIVSSFPSNNELCNNEVCGEVRMKEFLNNQLDRAKIEIKNSFMEQQDMENNTLRKERSVVFNISLNKILQVDAPSKEFSDFYYKSVILINGKILKFEKAVESEKVDKNLVRNFTLPTDYTFTKIFQWLDITFYVLGTKAGEALLYIYTPLVSSPVSDNFALKQRIHHPLQNRHAVDGEFFIYESNFYLFLLYDSPHQDIVDCIIYKWHNTYFDIDLQFVVNKEAVGITSFNYGSSVIISIIQSVSEKHDQKSSPAIFKPAKKARSLVLKFSSKDKGVSHIEKINILPTLNPQSVLHFQFFEDDCIFICEKESPSTVYRWEGGEFVKWFQVPLMKGCQTVVSGKISDSTMLFFISEYDKIVVYYMAYKAFVQFKTIPFPGEIIAYGVEGTIVSALVKVQDSLKAIVFELILQNPIVVDDWSFRSLEGDDPFHQCFGSLEKELGKANERFLDIHKEFSNLLFTDKTVVLPGSIQVTGPESDVTVSKGTITNLTNDYYSCSRIRFIDDDLDKLFNESTMLLQNGFMNNSDIIFKRDVYTETLKLNSATARLLNNYTVDESKLISLSKDQYLINVNVKSMSVNWLVAEDLKSKHVSELVVNNGSRIEWDEIIVVSDVVCCNMLFNHKPLINGINLNNIVQKNKQIDIVSGIKRFSRIEADKVMTKYINEVPFDVWFNDNLNAISDYEGESDLYLSNNCTIDYLNVKYIDGLNINLILKNLYRYGINHFINGNLYFDKGFQAKTLKTTSVFSLGVNSFTKQRSTDGHNIIQAKRGDSSTRDNPKHIYKKKLFIRGCLQVNEIIFVNCHLICPVGNKTVAIDSVRYEYWMNNTNQIIPEKVKFYNKVNVIGNLLSLNYINKINISDLITSRTKEIMSSLSFKQVEIIGNVTALSNYSDSKLFDFEKLYKFSTSAFVEDIVDSPINTNENLRYNPPHELNQDSPVKKKIITCCNLIVEGNIEMNSINDVSVNRTSENIYGSGSETKKFIFSNVTARGINVKRLNGVPFIEVIHFNADKAPKKIINKLLVKYNLSLVGMDVNKVNGIIINEVLPKVVNTSQYISVKGRKIFKSKLVIDNSLITDLTNNFNITQLTCNFLSKSIPQNITGEYHLKNVSMNSLKSKSVNSINTSSFVDINNSEEIFLQSDEIIFERLLVNGDTITYDKLKDCHLPKDQYPLLLEDSEMKWSVINVLEDMDWHSHNSKGKLQTLFDDAVTLNDAQSVTGCVIFEKNFITGNVFTNKSINGVNVSNVISDAVWKNKKNQVISGEKIFVQTINCVNSSVLKDAFIEVVSGVNITNLNETVVRKNVDEIIRGHKFFKNGFTSHFLNINGNINGSSSQNIFLTNTNKKLPHVKFASLEIMNNLQFDSINGINLQGFLAERVIIKDDKTHKQNALQSDLVFNGSINLMGETFANSMNDIIIDDVLINDVTSKNKPNVHGCKIFHAPFTVLGKLLVHLINAKNISNMYNSSVLADTNTTIAGNLKVNGNVFMGKGLHSSSFRVNQKQVEFLNEANKTMFNFISSLLMDDHN